jgi:hypothetical protein
VSALRVGRAERALSADWRTYRVVAALLARTRVRTLAVHNDDWHPAVVRDSGLLSPLNPVRLRRVIHGGKALAFVRPTPRGRLSFLTFNRNSCGGTVPIKRSEFAYP